MRTLTIGGLNLSSLALRDAVALPLLDAGVPVLDMFADCLGQVAAERRGVVLLAPQGAGKSIAIARDVSRFNAEEERRRAELDAQYQPRRIIVVGTLRIRAPRDLYRWLFKQAFGTDPVEYLYRRKKTDEELRADFIARCVEENVVAVVVDEAQTLEQPILDALRDLMAVAEPNAAERIETTADGVSSLRPQGVGVLLVGTLAVQARLHEIPEIGRRWIRSEIVGLTEAADAPGMLAKLLPAFAQGAAEMGEEAWATFIAQAVTRGHTVPISTLADLTRGFIRRVCDDQPDVQDIKDLHWNQDIFQQAAYELLGLSFFGAGVQAA